MRVRIVAVALGRLSLETCQANQFRVPEYGEHK
jgi:hypothetical protein